MSVVPVVTPVTTPLAVPTVAIAGFADVHTPPLVALLSVVVLPWHTTEAPVIVPAFASAPTVMVLVVNAVPHEFVIV